MTGGCSSRKIIFHIHCSFHYTFYLRVSNLRQESLVKVQPSPAPAVLQLTPPSSSPPHTPRTGPAWDGDRKSAHCTSRAEVPGSERTSLAAAMSMNFFSAFFFSSSFWKLSGCHCSANFRYALMISCFLAFLKDKGNYLVIVRKKNSTFNILPTTPCTRIPKLM